MHRYKIVPSILLILSLVNFLLAAPAVLREVRQACVDMADVPEGVLPGVSQSEKRSDELENHYSSDEPRQKRGPSSGSSPTPSVGEPPAGPADQELAPNPPPSSETGTGRIQDAASASSPEIINKRPPSDEGYLSSGESYPSDHGSVSSENYYASDEGGPGPSKSYSDAFSKTRVGSYGGSPGSSKSYPPSDGPGPDLAPNEGRPLSNRPEMVSTGRPVLEPPLWNPHDWSTTSSESEPEPKPKNNFMSKTKNFFDKLVYKIKFWPRGPEAL